MAYIGELVKQFESGSKGSLSFCSCGYDMGLSCGSYQLTLSYGTCIKFLQKYFPNKANKLYFKKNIRSSRYPGADYCSNPETVKQVWTECYNSVGAELFFKYEYEYIKTMYYDQLVKKIGDMFNPNIHSRMAQECLWSWAVHRGVTGAYKEFCMATKGLNTQQIEASKLIDILYDARFKTFSYNRYKKGIDKSQSEREKLRCMALTPPLPLNNNTEQNKTHTQAEISVMPLNGYIRFKTLLNIRDRPSWDDSAIHSSKPKGTVLTVVGKVKVGNSYMYKTKAGFYVTTNAQYVEYLKTI